MNIVITVTSFQRLTPEQNSKKIFNSIGGTIGRVAHADLLLLDHDKVISKVHARIDCEQGTYYLSDTSTNGVFVNDNIEPLGREHRHALKDGDKLRLGDYELAVAFTTEEPVVTVESDPLDDMIQSQESDAGSSMSMLNQPSSARQKVVHLAQEQDAFQPPSARLPENWNYGDAESNEASVPQEVQAPQQASEQQQVSEQQPVQVPQEVQVFQQASEQHAQTPQQAQVPQQAAHASQPIMAEPMPYSHEYVPSDKEQMVDIVPFLNGLGLDVEKNTTLRPSVMFELGKTLRDLLGGMLETMSARAELKSEFRVMQTTIRSQENNPIKFSVDTNEMIQNLFFRNLKSFLKPKDAIAEAFKDLNAHEIALMAGVQSAVNGILEELDPEMIRQKQYANTGLGKLIPGKQNERYWQIYTNYYQEIRRSIAEGNNRFIDIDFAKAYEDKLNELK